MKLPQQSGGLHTANTDLMAVEYDLELLKILELSSDLQPADRRVGARAEQHGDSPRVSRFDAELRVKLCAQLKGRTRPLLVAAYDKSSVGVEKAVEAGDKPYGEIAKFSKFLLKCKEVYWELGDLLGRFEQTSFAAIIGALTIIRHVN